MRKKFLSCLFLCCLAACLSTGCKKITFPTNEYPNGQLLVDGDFLESILDTQGLVIIDARTSGYEAGHIPGAINLRWTDFVDDSTMLLSVADISKKLGAAGISRDKTYVIYDDTLKAWGAAGRIFWMLEYMGCSDVHILNGGWDLWTADKRQTETDANTLPAAFFIPAVRKDSIATQDHIAERLDDDDFVVIDSRTDEEFNGWQLYGEARGGHIPGAVQIPYEWFFISDNNTVLSYNELNYLFTSRGVTTDKEVTSYCTAGIRSGFVYFALRLLGYPQCSNYANSMFEWSANPAFQMDKLQHYEKLVPASWVKDLIEGKNPATYTGNGYLILEARYVSSATTGTSADPNTIGYIPGAVSVHPCYFEHGDNSSKYYPNYSTPSDGNLLPSDELKQALENLGITKDTTVVVYSSGVIIQMTSARVAWALMHAGVKDVRILNGGYPAWLAIGGQTDENPAEPSPVADFSDEVPAVPEWVATTDYVKEISEGINTGSVLVDERTLTEYIGADPDYYPFFTTTGHIPNAVWMGDWTELVDMKDNTYRCYTEVKELWDGLGITSDKEPVFYCGTGWRSTIGFIQAYTIGYANMRNYDGSFYEWSWGGVNPVSTDAP